MRLTHAEYAELVRKHPHLVAHSAAERKRRQEPALVQNAPAKQASQRCVEIRVAIIQCRRRLCDDDNAIAGAKHLRDCISESLGLDDADPRISFEYSQVKTSGDHGVIVKIQRI